MGRGRRGVKVVSIGAALVIAMVAAGASLGGRHDATRPVAPNCTPVLDANEHGRHAVDKLGANLDKVAQKHGKGSQKLKDQLLADQSLWVDTCGELFFSEEKDEIPVDPPQLAPTLVFPAEQTFLLHSKAGATKVIYLDFNGELISGTAWNNSFTSGQDIAASAFDIDGSPGTFSNDERAIVQNVWLRVAEDYAAFNVDVTTEDPGAAAIDRTSSTDANFGARALVTNESQLFTACGCAGISYVGVFDMSGSHQYYQPSWVFQRGTGSNAKVIGEVISHEIGHSLGLSHDGTSTAAYYSGQGSWAPIMGTAYNRPISQWSKGDYAGANNTEDDLAIIQSHGLALKADDAPDSRTSATPLQTLSTFNGRIGSTTDVDWFSFTGSGQADISVTVAPTSPNLDVDLDLYDSSGNLRADSDPDAATVSGDVATGLSAVLSYPLQASGTYYIRIAGVGYGDPLTNGYSDYSSVGDYKLDLRVSDASTSPSITTSSLPNALYGQAYSTTQTASGGVPPYHWGITSDSAPLPDALALTANTGLISGVPTAAAGTYQIKFKVVDSQGNSSTSTLSLTVADAPLVITTGLPMAPASLGVPYSTTLAATGARGNYVWSLASGTLPAGVAMSATGELSGTPINRATTYSFTVRVSSGQATTTKSLSISVTNAVRVTTVALADGTLGVSYSGTLAATGGTGKYVWDIDPQMLPPGLSVSANKIVGIPTQTGSWGIPVRVTDTAGRTATKTVPLTIYGKPVILTTSLPNVTRGVFYSVTLAAEGGKVPYKWTRSSGSLPRGLSISTAGVLSGTTSYAGTYTITFKCTDAGSRYGLQTLTLIVV
jgi:hypothetical protein